MKKIARIALILLFLGAMIPPMVRAGIIYVPTLEYPSIKSAIGAAVAGDEVIVKPGTYYELIVLKKGVTVRSFGTEEERQQHITAKRTIIDAGGQMKPVIEGADGAIIDGFTITGLGHIEHRKPGDPHGIQCRGTSPIIINNIIRHMGSTAIGCHVYNEKEANPYIANNIIYANDGMGIGNNHGSAGTIINNIIYSNRETGIGIKNGAHPLIENNTVYNNGLAGIGAKDGAFPVIRGNRCYNNGLAKKPGIGAGIGMQNTFVPLIEKNVVYNNILAGIGLRRDAKAIIKENIAYNNGSAGIALKEGATALITYNECYGNLYGGIGMDGAKSVTIEYNKIHHNKKGGIGLTNKSSAIIKNNKIYGNVNAAISPATEYSIIGENEMYDNGEVGSGAPPAMTQDEGNPLNDKSDEAAPPGLPSSRFFDWVKEK